MIKCKTIRAFDPAYRRQPGFKPKTYMTSEISSLCSSGQINGGGQAAFWTNAKVSKCNRRDTVRMQIKWGRSSCGHEWDQVAVTKLVLEPHALRKGIHLPHFSLSSKSIFSLGREWLPSGCRSAQGSGTCMWSPHRSKCPNHPFLSDWLWKEKVSHPNTLVERSRCSFLRRETMTCATTHTT